MSLLFYFIFHPIKTSSFPGGYLGHTPLATSLIYENGAFVSGPDFALALSSHCMTKLNETHPLLIGGYLVLEYTDYLDYFTFCI